jgi:hypothetical protein
MKKHILLLVLLIIISKNIGAQELQLQMGYLTFNDEKTIIAPILMTNNNRSYIRYKKDKDNPKLTKVKKSELLDFGVIHDGEKQSKYAKFGFDERAWKGYYINYDSQDTIPFYFLKYTESKIEGYSLDRKSITLFPKDILSVKKQEHAKEVIFDGIVIRKKKSIRHTFLEQKSSGRILMYTMNIRKKELEKIDDGLGIWYLSPSVPSLEHFNYKIKTSYTFVHIIKKGERMVYIPFNADGPIAENKLREYINDCAFINTKLGMKGYQIQDIYLIIEQYNELWKTLNCN